MWPWCNLTGVPTTAGHTHTEGNRVRTWGEEGVHTPRRQAPGGASAVHAWTPGVQPPDCEQVPF